MKKVVYDRSVRLVMPEKLYQAMADLAQEANRPQQELYRKSFIEFIEKHGEKYGIRYEDI